MASVSSCQGLFVFVEVCLFVFLFHLIVRVFSCQGLATSLPFAGAGWSGQADQTEGRRSKRGPSIPLEFFKMPLIVDFPLFGVILVETKGSQYSSETLSLS